MSKSILVSSILLISSFLFSSCSLTSGLGVPAKQQFVLGGNQKGAFKVKYENIGDQVLVLKEVSQEGEEIQSLDVKPGEEGILNFQKGSKALVVNINGSEGNLKAKITGNTNLGMRYEDVGRN